MLAARQAIGLPPLTFGADKLFVPERGGEFSVCMHASGAFINDSTGAHSAGCTKHASLKHAAHTELAVPYVLACKRVGFECSAANPSTKLLCGNNVSNEQFRAMLPKKPTEKSIKLQKEAVALLEELRVGGGRDKMDILNELSARLTKAVVADQGAVLTVDRMITSDEGRQLLIDQTFLHTTCQEHLAFLAFY